MTTDSTIPVLVFLFAQSPDNEPLHNLKDEKRIVNELLWKLDDLSLLKLVCESSAERTDLTSALERYHERISILHFGGHANGQGLYLEDGQAIAAGIADLLRQQRNIRMVFLNGCHTWSQAELFMEADVPVVIATNQAIPDAHATHFSQAFYSALTNNRTIAEAFELAVGILKTNEDYKVLAKDTTLYRKIGNTDQGNLGEDFPWLLYVNDEQSTALTWKLPQLLAPANEAEAITTAAAISFLSKEGKDLLPEDLLQDDRSTEFELRDEYYFKRSIDDDIYKHLSEQRGILLNSLPLNGKTTTVYKLLKTRFPDAQVHIAEDWSLSGPISSWSKGLELLRENIEKIGETFDHNFFIFDNVVQYLGYDGEKYSDDKVKEFRQLLKTILRNRASTVILISQTAQVEQVKAKLKGFVGNGTLIRPFKLPELTEGEIQTVKTDLASHNLSTDVNTSTIIGHYFIGLERFRQEYSQLTDAQKEFLWSYKSNYFIREFADRDSEEPLLQYYQLQHVGRPIADAKAIIEVLTKNNFLKRETVREENEDGEEVDKEKLRINEFLLEKIILQKENFKRTREEYLTEKVEQEIAESEETQIIQDLYRTYANSPDEERLNIYNRIMLRTSHNYKEVKRQVLEKIDEEELERDVFTFNILIYRSDALYPSQDEDDSQIADQDYAIHYYDQMIKEYKIAPNEYTLNFLIRKCPHHSKALEFYREIIDNYEVEPDEYTFRGLLAVSSNFLEAWSSYELFRSMNELEVDQYLNPSIYYNLLGQAETFTDAYRVYIAMEEVNQSYAHRYPEREKLIQPNADFYKSVIRKPGGSFDDAWELFLQAKQLDERGIDFYVLTCLIKKCNFYWQAQQVIDVIDGLQVQQLQPTLFNNLMKTVHDQKERQEIFKRMEALEVRPSKESYNTLMQLATLEEAKSIFEKMIEKGVKVDHYSFYHLIRKEEGFAAKWSRFISMTDETYAQYNLKSSITIINYLLGEMKAALSPEERHEKAEVLFEIIKKDELLRQTWKSSASANNAKERIRSCYHLLRGKLPVIEKKMELITIMAPFLSIVDYDFDVVVNMSEDYTQLNSVLAKMQELRVIRLNKSFALKLARKISAFEKEQNETQRGIIFSGILNRLKSDFVVEDEVLNQVAVNFIRKMKLDHGGIRLIYEYFTALDIKTSFALNQRLVWAYLEPQKEKNLGHVVRDIEKDYKVKIKVNPAYFESFMQRSREFSTVNTLYIAMIRHDVQPRRSTFQIMLKKVIEKKYVKHADIWRVLNIVNKHDQEYLTEMFELMISKKLHNTNHLTFILEAIRKYDVQLKDELIVQVFYAVLRRRKYDLDVALQAVKGLKTFKDINFSLLIQKVSNYDIARKIESYLIENDMEISEEVKKVILWMTPVANTEQMSASPTLLNLQIRKLKGFEAKKNLYQQLKVSEATISDFVYYDLVSSAPFMEGWEFYQEIKGVKEQTLEQRKLKPSWVNPLFVNQLIEKDLKDWHIRNLLLPELNRTQVAISEYWFECLTNIVWDENKDLELWAFIRETVQQIKIKPMNALYDQLVNLEKNNSGALKSRLEKFLSKAKDLGRIKILLRLMEEKKMIPTQNLINQLIRNFDTEQQLKEVVALLNSSELDLNINEEELLVTQFKLGGKEKKMVLFDKIWTLRQEQGRLRIGTYYALIEGFDFDKAFDVYQEMLASGISYHQLKTKNLLANLAEKRGCKEEGIKLIEAEAEKASVKSEAIYLKLLRYSESPTIFMAYLDSMIDRNMVITTKVKEQLIRSYRRYKKAFQEDPAFMRLEEKYEEIRKKKKKSPLTEVRKSEMSTDDALKLLEASPRKVDYKYLAILMSKPQTFEDAQKIYGRVRAKYLHAVNESFFENFLQHAKSFDNAFLVLKASKEALSTTSLSLLQKTFYQWADNFKDGFRLFEMLYPLPKSELQYLSICVDLLGLYEGTFQEESVKKVFAYIEDFPYWSSNKTLKNYTKKCIDLIGRIPDVQLAKKILRLMTRYLGAVQIPLVKALFPMQQESGPGICLEYLSTIRFSLPDQAALPELIAEIACNKVNSIDKADVFAKVYRLRFRQLEVTAKTRACLAKYDVNL